jgi:protein-disulfide isomerase
MVRNRALIRLGAVVALAAIVVVGAILLSGGDDDKTITVPEPPGSSEATEVQDLYVDIPQHGIRLGNRRAPATLVEIADLQCPFCAAYSREVLPTVVRDYVRTGRLLYELHFRSFLGRDSVRAAGAAAYAARENRMYQFADHFYRHQGPEESGYADRAFIESIAQLAGVDTARAAAAADDPLSFPAVKAGEMFARRLGSTGTPDFFIRKGGRLARLEVHGTAPEDYARALDAALGST